MCWGGQHSLLLAPVSRTPHRVHLASSMASSTLRSEAVQLGGAPQPSVQLSVRHCGLPQGVCEVIALTFCEEGCMRS